ncbi:GMC family oxidoreductase [Bradyrhizobium jicamae]|uniref:GMC family oxidoreductase n=1 Tax=Bradyrhizobium jicamae TaxID=280332 RepID=A0ABS5FT78_9BRAD|nr:GMC oxidoreductase [Bradyrhizobium jicamae]MBR0799958.1 GMC family oxidoreductase [Bradyrhizobium jicamae]
MGIYRTLADQLKASGIQDTTFSIDAIGNRICSSWETVNAANESQRFDVVVVGAGMFGAYCAEKLFRRDTSKKLKILVLDAGAFFLPTHVNNLPLGGMPDGVVWARPWTGEAPFVTDGNKRALAFCIGGRSLFWAGWSPELMPDDLARWPADIRRFLASAEGYDYTATEIGSNQTTDFIAKTDTYKKLDKALRAAAKKKISDVAQIDLVGEAPLAVMGSRPTPGIFPFDQYSSATFLIDAISQDLRESKDQPRDRHLMLLPRAEVIGLKRDDKQAVTSVDLEVRGDAKTLRLGPNTTVILANGTVEATRLALAHLDIGRQASGRPKVGNFMTHMGNSTIVRIRRSALGLGKPNQSENEVAAFIARGKAYGRRFHYQIVAASLREDVKQQTPWDFVMRLTPDIDQLDKLMSGHDPQWISVVFRGIAEMEDDRSLGAADAWRNSISLEQGGDRAYVKLSPSPNDNLLWNALDDVAIGLAKQLAGSPKNIQYRVNNDWQATQPTEPDHSDIGTIYHEGGTLFMGKVKESITDTNGKFHHLPNVYVAGPAVFPTLGSANPSLTGLTLARRTGDAILVARGIKPPKPRRRPPAA